LEDRMSFDWNMLGRKAPTTLIRARLLAHHALQWVSLSAHANLDPEPGDAHCSLTWDAAHALLLSQPMSGSGGGDVRVGLRLSGLALVIARGGVILDTFELAGRRESLIAVWLDSALRALQLKPVGDTKLPFTLPSHAVARGGAYASHGEAEALDELALWLGMGAHVLEAVAVGPGAGPVRCWPHHFEMATVIKLDYNPADSARSVRIGISMGDEHCPQPYVFVRPQPCPEAAALPQLPPPGHWRTHGFVAAVATAEAILALDERASALRAFIDTALARDSVTTVSVLVVGGGADYAVGLAT
jgi:hypothetical protein